MNYLIGIVHPEKLLMEAESGRLIRVRAFIPPQVHNMSEKRATLKVYNMSEQHQPFKFTI